MGAITNMLISVHSRVMPSVTREEGREAGGEGVRWGANQQVDAHSCMTEVTKPQGAMPAVMQEDGEEAGGEGARRRANLQEEAVTELHDVGLVDGGDLSPVIEEGVAERVLRHPTRALLGDDLQALYHVRHNLVLQPAVLPLRVFSAPQHAQA